MHLSLPQHAFRVLPRSLALPHRVSFSSDLTSSPLSSASLSPLSRYWSYALTLASGFHLVSPFRFCPDEDLIECLFVCRAFYHALSAPHTEPLWRTRLVRRGVRCRVGDASWRRSLVGVCAAVKSCVRAYEEAEAKGEGEGDTLRSVFPPPGCFSNDAVEHLKRYMKGETNHVCVRSFSLFLLFFPLHLSLSAPFFLSLSCR